MATHLSATRPASGATNGAPSVFASSWTTLVSNTSAKNMPTISSNASATITKRSTSIGMANDSVVSTWTGIMTNAHALSACPATSRMHSTNSSTPNPTRPKIALIPANAKQYGVKVQLTDPIDTTARLPKHEIKRLQQIISTFLFYGRAVDPTLLTALSELSSAQATATEATKRACHQFLDYCATHPTSTICYHASNMVLKLHSDSSYLNAIGARSRQGGHFFLGNKSGPDILYGAILHLAAIMKMVLSSAAEAAQLKKKETIGKLQSGRKLKA